MSRIPGCGGEATPGDRGHAVRGDALSVLCKDATHDRDAGSRDRGGRLGGRPRGQGQQEQTPVILTKGQVEPGASQDLGNAMGPPPSTGPPRGSRAAPLTR